MGSGSIIPLSPMLSSPTPNHFCYTCLAETRGRCACTGETDDISSSACILCTIAQEWHQRADAEEQEILLLLAQVQDCLLSLQDHARIDDIRKDLVAELALWQQWSIAQELTDAISISWCREEAQWSIVKQMLEAGLWEEVLVVVPTVDDWMFFSCCEACARMHAWRPAEEALQSIKGAGRKIDALSVLARELASVSEAFRAEAFWRQAVKIACEFADSFTLAFLGENLAKAHQWELAETIASALPFPLPEVKETGSELDAQPYSHSNALWIPVLRARVLATLAGEYTRAHYWERAGTLWEEARSLALSSRSSWHQTETLGDLTLRFAEANLWERALETWHLAEKCWLEARIRDEAAYEMEERDRRLSVLIPLSHHLVREQQWRQAWKLCQSSEDVSMKIQLGSEIATELDQLQQSTDSQMVWTQTREMALATRSSLLDLRNLALALEQAQRENEAEVVWKASVSIALEADQDDLYLRSLNCGWLALEMAQRQRREEAALLLNESIQAAVVLWEQRLRWSGLMYTDI